MPTIELGRWLLVAVVIVGLAFAATVVSAHGTDTTTDHPYNTTTDHPYNTTTDNPYNGTEAPPYNGTAAEWEIWMENHMTEHVGSGSVAWMESHMGVTVEEMAQHMAEANYTGHGAGYLHHDHTSGYGTQDFGHGGGYSVHDDTHRDDTHRGGYGMTGRGHGC